MARFLYGAKVSPLDERDHVVDVQRMGATNLPPYVDLRPNMPLIFTQNWSDCTANAFTSLMEHLAFKQGLGRVSYSRRFLYHASGILQYDTSDDGRDLRTCVKALAACGICTENLAPYSETEFAVMPTSEAMADAKQHTILEYARVPQDILSLKTILFRGFPISIGTLLYKSAESDAVAQSAHLPMPKPGEDVVGGHCVLLVGYTDTGYFIVRNSWGPQWGQRGYFYMPFDYVLDKSLTPDLWSITMERYF